MFLVEQTTDPRDRTKNKFVTHLAAWIYTVGAYGRKAGHNAKTDLWHESDTGRLPRDEALDRAYRARPTAVA